MSGWVKNLYMGVDRASGPDQTVGSLFVGGRHIPIVLDALGGHWRFYENKRWRNIEDIADLDQALQGEPVAAKEAAKCVDADIGGTANRSMALPEDCQDDLDIGANPLHFDVDFHFDHYRYFEKPRQIGRSHAASIQASITENGDEGKRKSGGVP